MNKVIFVDHQGTRRSIETNGSETLMEAAIKNDIPGIDADCGGACACATCHVYVDEQFLSRLEQPSDMEQSMLELAENVRSNSRLSCQINLTAELDGLVVNTPESQQ